MKPKAVNLHFSLQPNSALIKIITVHILLSLQLFSLTAVASEQILKTFSKTTTQDFRQQIALEFRQFSERSSFVKHNRDISFSWKSHYEVDWRKNNVRNNLTIVPFARYNSIDDSRSRFDIQSLSWSRTKKNLEFRSGIRTISWRVTEAVHLVDIINQTDLTGDVDGEDKLGQTMINMLWHADWGSVEAFILPGFRKRIFPGENARLRSEILLPPQVSNTNLERKINVLI